MKKRYLVSLLLPFLLASCGAQAVTKTSVTEVPSQSTNTTLPEDTSTEDTKTDPLLTTTEPDVTTTEPDVTTTEPEVTTTEPEVTPTEPEVTTTEPEVTTTEPEVTTTEPEETTTEPEVTTTEPSDEKYTVHVDTVADKVYINDDIATEKEFKAGELVDITQVNSYFLGWYVDGELVCSTSEYSFLMPEHDVDVYAQYKEYNYSITYMTQNLDGEWDSETDTGTITPLETFHLRDIPSDDFTIDAYRTEFNIYADYTDTVRFYRKSYDVSASSSSGHCTITGARKDVYSGTSLTLTFTPDDGYEISGLTVNGASVEPARTLVLTVREDYEIICDAQKVNADYSVNTHIEQQDGSYADTAEVFTGRIGELSGYTPEALDHYTVSFTDGVVEEDGSTVLDVYYNLVNVPVTIEGDNLDLDTTEYSYRYGSEVTLSLTAAAHYKVFGIKIYKYGTETDVSYVSASSVTFTADCSRIRLDVLTEENTSSYRVVRYLETLNGGFPYYDEYYESGYVGEMTDAVPQALEGYTARSFDQKVITENDGTYLEVYYERNTYAVSLDDSLGIVTGISGTGSHKYGSSVTVNLTFSPYYDVSDVFLNGVSQGVVSELTFTLEKNTVISVAASEKAKASYTIKHYLENTDGEYTEDSSETSSWYIGMTPDVTSKEYSHYSVGEIQNAVITEDGTAVVSVYYVLDQYTVSVTINGKGTISGLGTYRYGTSVTVSASAATGYAYAGITGDAECTDSSLSLTITSDVSLTVTFTPKEYSYTYNYYFENEDGTFSLSDFHETHTGYYDSLMDAVPLTREHYTLQSFNPSVITDSENVLDLYYYITTYTITVNLDGEEYGYVEGAGTYKYNTVVHLKAVENSSGHFIEYEGYTTWQKEIDVTITDDITISARFGGGAWVNVTLNHYLMDTNGEYVLYETEVVQKVERCSVDESNNTYEGFSFKNVSYNSSTALSDGSTVWNFYYNRYKWYLTIRKDSDVLTLTPDSGDVYYGAMVTLSATAEEGYDFVGWYDYSSGELVSADATYVFTMPNETVNLIARSSAASTAYNVEYYYQNIDDDGYTLSSSETLYAATDTTTALSPEVPEGFSLKSVTQTTVLGDGSAVVTVYYNRLTYTLTLSCSSDDYELGGAGTYKYNATADVTFTVGTGYQFVGWYDETGSLVSDITDFTLAMTEDVTLTAKEEKITYYLTLTIDSMYGSFADGASTVILEVCYGDTFTAPSVSINSTYIFTGFYYDGRILSDYSGSGYAYAYTKNQTGHAAFITSIYKNNGDDTITMGRYPQSQVTDSSVLDVLNALDITFTAYSTLSSYYYADVDLDCDGMPDYRAAKHDAVAVTSAYSDVYQEDTVYWFKYEDITWKILKTEDGEATLITSKIIDSERYGSYLDDVTQSLWDTSLMRSWLNGEFLSTALMPYESPLIPSVTIKNDLASTGLESSSYTCGDTEDKVYLLSLAEAQSLTSSEGTIAPTDYAVFRGVGSTYPTLRSSYAWATRTSDNYSNTGIIVCPAGTYVQDTADGFITRYNAIGTRIMDCPVRPVITLNL